MGSLFLSGTKWIFLLSLAAWIALALTKDRLPQRDYYDVARLQDPVQTPTSTRPFTAQAGGQTYQINPLFDYELDGVVVSYHDADSFFDIWHHKEWKDFVNVRDLCVVWGSNVSEGVYRELAYDHDDWTCWVQWDSAEIGNRFVFRELSNNHLLADQLYIVRAIMSAQPGDHIHFSGVLATYANPANGFQRGTSVVREDTGNGACETVFVRDFQIVRKANPGQRAAYSVAKWLSIGSFVLLVVLALLV
jgi:hypothetical protein